MDIIQSFFESSPSCCKTATAYDTVLNSECCFTFYTPYHEPDGILVSLNTFLGSIPELAFLTSGSDLGSSSKGAFVRIVKKRILNEGKSDKSGEVDLPTKLAIGVEGGFQTDSDKYNIISSYSVVILDHDATILAEVPYNDESKNEFPLAMTMSVDSIIYHVGLTTQQQVNETWQDEPVPVSKFAENLPFVDNGVKISPDPSTWRCQKTGATENLWLNLSDGYIGGGRKHWDGSGGSNGALDHFNETGQIYPLVVKLGTITAEINTADCYSYDPSEDGPVKVPNLAEILQKRGILIATLQKTVKSTAELEVELNANYAFDAITEAGTELLPVTGPGLQGLQNMGNSCYLNSVVQCLFSLPEPFKRYGAGQRYQMLEHPLLIRMDSPKAAPTDVLCQTAKLGTALTSGVFAKPLEELGNDSNHPKYRLAPRMFKHCICKDHADFRTGQQQDAAHFFQYLLEKIDHAELGAAAKQNSWLFPNGTDTSVYVTSHLFAFGTTNRIVCSVDGKVKYNATNASETILSLRLPMKKAHRTLEQDVASPDQKRLKPADDEPESKEEEKSKTKTLPTIALKTCLEEWAADNTVEGIRWPHLKDQNGVDVTAPATQRTRLSNFPRYLMIQIQRYELGPDWQPVKLEVNVQVPEELDLTPFKSTGPQEGEVVLTDDDCQEQQGEELSMSATNPSIDEVALSQLMEMGFSLNSCKRALTAVGGNDVEAAMGWVFEHNMDPDFNDPLPEDRDTVAASGIATAATGNVDEGVVMALVDSLGAFTVDQVRVALKECGGAADRAADWLFSHMDDLDEAMAASMSRQTIGPSQGGNQGGKAPKIPLEDGEGRYCLIGMISHIGKNTGSGHYVAHVKKAFDGAWKWVIFNDEKVALSLHPPKEHAYLYLYQRKDTFSSPHPSY